MMPERNCNKCTPQKKIEWGCEGSATLPVHIDDEDTFTCPMRPAFENRRLYAYLMEQHGYYRKGVMTVGGGIMDQPSKWCRAMAVIDQAVDECRAEKAKPKKRGK